MAQTANGKRPTTVTGIEYGDRMVRVATLSIRSGKPKLRALSQAEVTPGRPGVREDIREAKVGALKTALSKHSKDLGATIVGIPRESVISRVVSLPSVEAQEVREMLFFDVDRFLPFPADEAEVSYRILEQVGAAESRVLMVGARKQDLYEVLEDLEKAHVHPDRIDVDVHGSSYRCSREGAAEGGPFVAVHIDADQCTAALVAGGQVRLSRVITLGLEDFFGGGWSGASLEGGPETWAEGQRTWWNQFRLEMRRVLTLFSHDPFGAKPEKIVLGAVTGEIPALSEALGEELGLEVEWTPSLSTGKVQESPEPFSSALGLALEEGEGNAHINLIPEEVYERYETARKKRFLANTALLLFVNLLLAGGLLGHSFWNKRQVVQILQAKIDKIQPEIRDVEKIAEKLAIIDANIDHENTAFRVLKEVFEITPDRIRIEKTTFKKSSDIELDFETFTYNDNNDYLTILSKSPYFAGSLEGGNQQLKQYQKTYKFPQTIKVSGLKTFLRSNRKFSE